MAVKTSTTKILTLHSYTHESSKNISFANTMGTQTRRDSNILTSLHLSFREITHPKRKRKKKERNTTNSEWKRTLNSDITTIFFEKHFFTLVRCVCVCLHVTVSHSDDIHRFLNHNNNNTLLIQFFHRVHRIFSLQYVYFRVFSQGFLPINQRNENRLKRVIFTE